MALIHFTPEDKAIALLVNVDPMEAEQILIRIEAAPDCKGIGCGERMELLLSVEDYDKWLEFHNPRPPIEEHSHLVIRGVKPDTLPMIWKVSRVRHD